MLENEVIKHLCIWLEANGWKIESTALNRDKGDDIRASKDGRILLVEAKGAKGNPENHSVVRDIFSPGQIKDHLGKAIVKALELKAKNPNALIVIAHPATEKILSIVKPIAPQLISVGFLFVFVRDDGAVEWMGQLPGEVRGVA